MIFQSMKMALKSIKTNKLRSFLTMLGIIIGVFALVVLVSMVSGATSSITDTISNMGTDSLTVYIFSDDKPLKMTDLDEIKELETVTAVAPVARTSLAAKTSRGEENISIIGTTPSYLETQNLNLAFGRFLMTPDLDNNTNVCVINYDMAQYMMGRQDVVGEVITIGGKAFTIVGVLEKENANNNMMSMLLMDGGNYTAYIPYTSAARLSTISSVNGIRSFYVAAEDGMINEAEQEVTDFLKKHFARNVLKLNDSENEDEEYFSEDYYIYNESMFSEAMDQVTNTLSLLLGGIAGISLLVGGIGIMNIMLVSVTERTKEIGIRKAIGARPGVIMLQFLIEAITLSIVGCATGIALSWIAIIVIDVVGNVSYGLSIPVVIVAVLFSTGIGVLFGLYPARRAAKMKPIDALRFN